MKKYFFILIAALIACTVAIAQPDDGSKRPKKPTPVRPKPKPKPKSEPKPKPKPIKPSQVEETPVVEPEEPIYTSIILDGGAYFKTDV